MYEGYDYVADFSQNLYPQYSPTPSGTYFMMYYSYRDPYLNIAVVADCLSTTCWIALGVSNNNVTGQADGVHVIYPAIAQADYLGVQRVTDYWSQSGFQTLSNIYCTAGAMVNCAGKKKRIYFCILMIRF